MFDFMPCGKSKLIPASFGNELDGIKAGVYMIYVPDLGLTTRLVVSNR